MILLFVNASLAAPIAEYTGSLSSSSSLQGDSIAPPTPPSEGPSGLGGGGGPGGVGGIGLKENVTIEKVCPTCPVSSDWSECSNGIQTRTSYKCSSDTNYTCLAFTETRDCYIPTPEVPSGEMPTEPETKKEFPLIAFGLIGLFAIIIYLVFAYKDKFIYMVESTVAEVLSDPRKFSGKIVTLTGIFSEEKMSEKTGLTWYNFRDPTGSIYVYGKIPGLYGRGTVKGKVDIVDGNAVIRMKDGSTNKISVRILKDKYI